MKEDKLFVTIFILLLAILALAIMPRYTLDNAITGAVVMASSGGISTNILILIGAIVIGVVLGLLVFFLKRKPKSAKVESFVNPREISGFSKPVETRAPKSEHEALSNYVKAAVAQGQSQSQIRKTLLEVGWPTSTVEKVMNKL